MVNDTTRKHVYDMDGSEKSFIPKFERHGSAGQKSKANFNDVPMLAFS